MSNKSEIETEPKIPTFKLVRQEKKVCLEGSDGVAREWTIRELSGSQRDEYNQKMSERMGFDKSGKPTSVKNFMGFHDDLLCMSLFDPDGKPASVTDLKAWPTTVKQTLFEMSSELSGLEPEDEAVEKSKNGSEARD